jgi:hypothetical protein
MKEVPANKSSRRFIHAAYPAVICVLILIAWVWSDFRAKSWQFKYVSEVKDIAALMNQYQMWRAKTGEWPDPNALYGTFFSLKSSEKYRDVRIDTFWSPPGPTLRFRLNNEGQIDFDVSWDEFTSSASGNPEQKSY